MIDIESLKNNKKILITLLIATSLILITGGYFLLDFSEQETQKIDGEELYTQINMGMEHVHSYESNLTTEIISENNNDTITLTTQGEFYENNESFRTDNKIESDENTGNSEIYYFNDNKYEYSESWTPIQEQYNVVDIHPTNQLESLQSNENMTDFEYDSKTIDDDKIFTYKSINSDASDYHTSNILDYQMRTIPQITNDLNKLDIYEKYDNLSVSTMDYVVTYTNSTSCSCTNTIDTVEFEGLLLNDDNEEEYEFQGKLDYKEFNMESLSIPDELVDDSTVIRTFDDMLEISLDTNGNLVANIISEEEVINEIIINSEKGEYNLEAVEGNSKTLSADEDFVSESPNVNFIVEFDSGSTVKIGEFTTRVSD